jgi:hypothetical protein
MQYNSEHKVIQATYARQSYQSYQSTFLTSSAETVENVVVNAVSAYKFNREASWPGNVGRNLWYQHAFLVICGVIGRPQWSRKLFFFTQHDSCLVATP